MFQTIGSKVVAEDVNEEVEEEELLVVEPEGVKTELDEEGEGVEDRAGCVDALPSIRAEEGAGASCIPVLREASPTPLLPLPTLLLDLLLLCVQYWMGAAERLLMHADDARR